MRSFLYRIVFGNYSKFFDSLNIRLLIEKTTGQGSINYYLLYLVIINSELSNFFMKFSFKLTYSFTNNRLPFVEKSKFSNVQKSVILLLLRSCDLSYFSTFSTFETPCYSHILFLPH